MAPSPNLPRFRFLFHTYLEEKRDESDFLTWILEEAEDQGRNISAFLPEEDDHKKLRSSSPETGNANAVSVRTCDLGLLANTIANDKSFAGMPALIRQKALNIIRSRRMIATYFESVTEVEDKDTRTRNNSHAYRADRTQRAFDILESFSPLGEEQSIASAPASNAIKALHQPSTCLTLADESTVGQYTNTLNGRTVRFEETQQERFQAACLRLIHEQGKLRTLASHKWAQVLLGRVSLIEASLVDLVVNELAQHNMQSFWTSQADLDHDFEATFFHTYYESVCESRGVSFAKDILDKNSAGLGNEKIADVVRYLYLPVRQLLKCNIGLLEPKVAREAGNTDQELCC